MFSKYSVKRPFTVFVAIILVLVLGVISYMNITVDLVPSVNLPYVVITTTYVGASPEKIEKEVSEPLEVALSGINNMENIKSVSSENLSMMILEFNEKVNIDAAMIEIRENIDIVKNSFDEGIENPVIMKLNPNSLPVLLISISSENMTDDELVKFTKTSIMSKIKSVEGVAAVDIDGESRNILDISISEKKINKINEEIKEIFYRNLLLSGAIESTENLNIDLPETLRFDISREDLQQFLLSQNLEMPSYMIANEDGQSIRVKIGSAFEEVKQIENLLLASIPSYVYIKLSDICDIKSYDDSESVYTKVNGKSSIVLSIQKQSDFSTAEITKSVWEKIDDLRDENAGLIVNTLMDQGRYVDIMISQISRNLVLGACFAILVLLFFLRNFRATLIVAASIFISIITALILMFLTGISLNMISLGGLALGVGMLVDNSIVVLENIFRFRKEETDMSLASIKGAREVSSAIIASTLTTVIVFVPIIFTHGLTRELFTDMALTIAFALISSLLVALTLVPTASSFMSKKEKTHRKNMIDRLVNGYFRLLKVTLSYKWVVFSVALILFVTSVLTILKSDVSLFPDMDSGNIWIKADLPSSYTDREKNQALDNLYERISDIDEVKTIGIIDNEHKINSSNIMMSLAGEGIPIYVLLYDDRDKTTDEVCLLIDEATNDLAFPLHINSDGLDLSQMMSDDIVVELYDNDINNLISKSKSIKEDLMNIEGIDEISFGVEKNSKELRILVDKSQAMKYNISVGQVYLQISDYIKPSEKIFTFEDSDKKEYDIYVVDDRYENIGKSDLENYVFDSISGMSVKLNDIAEISEEDVATNIYRNDGNRYMSLNISIKDTFNVKNVNDDVEEILMKKDLDYKISGEVFEISNSFSELYMMAILAIIFIYLIMVAQFQSLVSPFIVMFTILLAFTGGFFALYISNYPVSIISIIGLIVLAGIVVNNGIVFVDYANQQMKKGLDKRQSILLSGKNRLRPILMTALTTIIALLTSALDTSMGSEMMRPMAITTIGGMIYATVLTLFLIPALYDTIIRQKRG